MLKIKGMERRDMIRHPNTKSSTSENIIWARVFLSTPISEKEKAFPIKDQIFPGIKRFISEAAHKNAISLNGIS